MPFWCMESGGSQLMVNAVDITDELYTSMLMGGAEGAA